MKFAIEKLGERKGKIHTWTQVRIVFDGDPGSMQAIYVPNEIVDEFIEFMSKGPAIVEAAHDLVDNHFDPIFCALQTKGLMPSDEVNAKVGKLWGALNASHYLMMLQPERVPSPDDRCRSCAVKRKEHELMLHDFEDE